jgi:hypothetical protein
MRRARRTVGLGLVAVLLVAVQTASAAPSIRFSMRAIPIPKNLLEPQHGSWPHTGNMVGAEAELEASFTITGSEDDGLPNELRQVMLYLPSGLIVHRSGFATCSIPHHWFSRPCPPKTFAGALTERRATLDFVGAARLAYPVSQAAVFVQGGGLDFWEYGQHTAPVTLNGFSKGGLTPSHNGYKLTDDFVCVQPCEYVKGLILSTQTVTVALGAAYQRAGRLTSYLTLPKTCPVGGFPVRAELFFGGNATPASWEMVAIKSKEPCGKRFGVKRSVGQTAVAKVPAPKTVIQCKKQFKHNAKARANCIKRVKHKGKNVSGCSLETRWVDGSGQHDDTKDFSVKLKGVGEPGPLQVVVTRHNPRIIVCSATISLLESVESGGKTGYKEVVFAVTIGSNGGASSKVTLPETGHFYAPTAKVHARLK